MKKSPIIVLHGWGLSKEKFSGLRQELSKRGFSVFIPDLPGFGATPSPGKPLVLSDYVDFVYRYIRQHAINRPVIIGHSFGGRIALKFQSAHPDAVRALVLTGTPGYTPVWRKRLVFFTVIAKIGKCMLSILPVPVIRNQIRAWYYYLVGARDYYRASGVMRETFKHIVREDLTGYMKSVSVPCLLVWGAQDRITPVWIAERMSEVIPRAKSVTIPGADHGVSYKEPKRFAESIQSFLLIV
jgi:pimeloyl-ACP methyl ester carboxylesterase